MSNFLCSQCGTALIDSSTGYVTFCKHYPLERVKEPRFEIFTVGRYYHYFRLLAPDGRVMMVSDNYPNLADCEKQIETLQAIIPWAVVVLPDGKEKRELL